MQEKKVQNPLPENKQSRVKKEVFSYIRMLVIVVVAVVILTQFVIINARIPSGSMEDTIMTGDRVIGLRFSYRLKDPKRGDIVLFEYPVDPEKLYIKRCIGLPGETVTIRHGGVYINDSETPLQEDYLPEEWTIENDGYTFTVPEGCFLMLGDNRNYSEDARYWAECALHEGLAENEEEAQEYVYVRKKQIKGKAVWKYFRRPEILTDTADYEE